MPLTLQQREYVATIEKMLVHENSDAVLLEGFEAALIGFVNLWSNVSVAVYDAHTIVEILVRNFEMEPKDALAYFHNQIDTVYMGPSSPLFLQHPDRKEEFAAWG